MSFRTLLVHLDGDARCQARVAVALQMARQFEAHLVGLAATGELSLPPVVETDLRAWSDLVERVKQDQRARAQSWVDAFQSQARAAGHADVDGLLVEGDAEAAVIAHGRWSDLVVLGQSDKKDAGRSVPIDFPQRVFMEIGRPVLLLPRVGPLKTLGSRVMVAWSDTRESARALADAMPLLQAAQEVVVLNIDRPDEAGVSRLELNDLQHALRRHGVPAECLQASTHEDYGDTLLLRALGYGADLLVMGGFGHARWAELALGGVTRTVLNSAAMPVLLSR